eukprot:scaffold15683_cov71-Skeletonema_dohrnii-CCMP3373.AAC.4
MPVQSKHLGVENNRNIQKEVLRPKRKRLILLFATLFAIYWTSDIWLTLIDTFNLYAAGDDIYNFINLEKLQIQIGNTPVEIPRIIHRMWPNDEFLKQDNLEITSSFNRCIDLYRKR